MERGEVGGARHGVIHERAGEDLALAVELDVFHQNLADALAMPPSTWPCSNSGLITVPTSSTTL